MTKTIIRKALLPAIRHYSRICPPPPARASPIIQVSNNISRLGFPKKELKLRQLLSLPAFPAILNHPLPGRNMVSHHTQPTHVTAVTWLKYYFDEISGSVIQSHFNKGLVQMECSDLTETSKGEQNQGKSLRKYLQITPNEVMKIGTKLHVPVSLAETKISKRFDTIPSGTLYPNADEIEYLQRLVMYKDSAIMILNKPPKLPVKGNLPVHNSMDALAAAALSYGSDEGPKLVNFN